MALDADGIERLFREHAASTDERFNRVMGELQSDRKFHQETVGRISSLETQMGGFGSTLTRIDNSMAEITKTVHKPKERFPVGQSILIMVAVFGLVGALVVGYVSGQFSHAREMSTALDAADRQTETLVQAERDKAALAQSLWLGGSLDELNDRTHTNAASITENTKSIAVAGERMGDAHLEIEKLWVFANEMKETQALLRESKAGNLVTDFDSREFIKEHVRKEGAAGHPIPQRNINPDKGAFPVNQQ